MKSNLNMLFEQIFEKYRRSGTFSVDDIVDEIMDDFSFSNRIPRKDLERFYVKTRVESMLSQNECYSYKKNNFVALDKASLENLQNIDANMVKDIGSRQKTLDRIRERETQVGQMEMQIEGSEIVGTEERRSIADIFKEVVNS